jgi:molecular chaperone GrpE
MNFEESNPDNKDAEKQEAESQASSGSKTPGEEMNSEERKELKKHEKQETDDVKILKKRLKKKDHELEHLKKHLEHLRLVFESQKKDAADLKDKYLRALAEMDNLRKRLEREKNDFLQYALGDILKELLFVLDNFERAFKNKDQTDGKSFHQGVELIYKQFVDLLRRQGVTPIDLADKKFDPNLHQALLTEESEGVQDAEISEELQKGYKLHDRLLRPSLVKVVIPKKS